MNIFGRVDIRKMKFDYYISYRKLFDVLVERDKKLSDLREVLSPKVVAKFAKNETVNTVSIARVCGYLNCQPGDIMEVREYINFKGGK